MRQMRRQLRQTGWNEKCINQFNFSIHVSSVWCEYLIMARFKFDFSGVKSNDDQIYGINTNMTDS